LLGATLGTFVGVIIKKLTATDATPIWCQMIGIVIGCLLGILIPKLIVGNSKTMGLNKMKASVVLLGTMSTEELTEIMHDRQSLFMYRSEKVFRSLDTDNF